MSQPSSSSGDKRILVVEDDREIVSIIQHLGAMIGLKIDCFFSGDSALESFSADGAEVVLLDLRLGDMNGLEVARQLRSLPHGQATKLVLTSGEISNETRTQAESLGFAKILKKPFAVRDLIQLLKDLTESSN